MSVKQGNRSEEFLSWIDARFPLSKLWREHVSEYYAPKNLNFWYYFGAILLVVLGLQLLTGIFLAMNYKPSAREAFDSVQFIMRDIRWDGSSATSIQPGHRLFSSSFTCI